METLSSAKPMKPHFPITVTSPLCTYPLVMVCCKLYDSISRAGNFFSYACEHNPTPRGPQPSWDISGHHCKHSSHTNISQLPSAKSKYGTEVKIRIMSIMLPPVI